MLLILFINTFLGGITFKHIGMKTSDGQQFLNSGKYFTI